LSFLLAHIVPPPLKKYHMSVRILFIYLFLFKFKFLIFNFVKKITYQVSIVSRNRRWCNV